MKTSNNFYRICFTLTILALLALGCVLMNGCQSPITNTVTIGATGIVSTNAATNAPVVYPPPPASTLCDSIMHAIQDVSAIITGVKKTTEELKGESASEAQASETIISISVGGIAVVVISAGVIVIRVRKHKQELSEQMHQAKQELEQEVKISHHRSLDKIREMNEEIKVYVERIKVSTGPHNEEMKKFGDAISKRMEEIANKLEMFSSDNRQTLNNFDKLFSKQLEQTAVLKTSVDNLSRKIGIIEPPKKTEGEIDWSSLIEEVEAQKPKMTHTYETETLKGLYEKIERQLLRERTRAEVERQRILATLQAAKKRTEEL